MSGAVGRVRAVDVGRGRDGLSIGAAGLAGLRVVVRRRAGGGCCGSSGFSLDGRVGLCLGFRVCLLLRGLIRFGLLEFLLQLFIGYLTFAFESETLCACGEAGVGFFA